MKNLKFNIRNMFGLDTDDSMFEINNNRIEKTNLSFLQQISFIFGFIMLALFSLSFIITALENAAMTHFAMFMVAAIIFTLTCVATEALKPYSFMLLYFLLTIIMIYCALVGIYWTPEGTATAFIVMIAIVPLLILDKQSHVMLYTILLWAAFCIAAYILKDFKYAVYDIASCTGTMLIGLLLNPNFFKARISNINNTRILERQVQVDALTGLPNYKKLMEDLSGEKDTRISKSLCSLAIIDIDLFKEYNISYGREMGNKCLKKIGNCMLRVSDPGELIIYRLGGTRSVAVSLIHDYAGIKRVCQGISALVSGMNIEHHGSKEGKITVSCGYADVLECECDGYKQLLEMAEKALEYAQKEGANTNIGYLQLKSRK